jgi:hypothetical protein
VANRIALLAAGFYVAGHPAREHSYLTASTPYVNLRQSCGPYGSHLTPGEARALAAALIAEADHAENGGYCG